MTTYAGSHGEPYRKGGPHQKRKGNPVITRYPPPPGYRQPSYLPPYQQGQGPSPTHQPYTQTHQAQYQAPGPGPYQHQQAPYQQPTGPYQHAQNQYQPQQHQQGPYQYPPGPYPQAQGGYAPAQGGYQYPQNAYQQVPYGQPSAPYQHPASHPTPTHGNSGSYPPAATSPPHPAQNGYPSYAAGSPSHAHHNTPHTPHQGYGGYPPTPSPQYGPPPTNGYQPSPTNGYAPSVQPYHPQQGPRAGHEHTNGNHRSGGWHVEPESNEPPAPSYQPPPDVDEEPPPRRLPKSEKLVYALEDDHQYWDQESGSGALWPKAGDYVNPRTSIGVQIWRAPQKVTRALPSSWAAADKQSETEPSLGNGESVSEYFGPDNAYEAHLDIRHTDHWKEVEHWPEFMPVDISGQIIPLEVVKSLRDRPDVEVVEEEQQVSPEPALASPLGKKGDQEEWNVMDTLDKALDPSPSVAEPDEMQKTPTPQNGRRDSNDRTPTGPSASSRSHYPPSHVEPQRTSSYSKRPQHNAGLNASQEEILARLGVTGDPKPLTQGKFRRASGGPGGPPPPPPPPAPKNRSPSIDPWTSNGYNTAARSTSVHSNGSHHTLAGSDFNPDAQTEAMNTTDDVPSTSPDMKQESPLSRKRSRGTDQYTSGQTEDRSNDGGRQPDDGGRRKRPKPNSRSHTNPYGRR